MAGWIGVGKAGSAAGPGRSRLSIVKRLAVEEDLDLVRIGCQHDLIAAQAFVNAGHKVKLALLSELGKL